MGLFKKIGKGIGRGFKRVGQGLGLAESEGTKYAKRAALEFDNIKAPEFKDLRLSQQSGTEFDNMDRTGSDAQRAALSQLQNVYQSGGLTAQDLSQLDDIRRRQAVDERGQREALLQNAQARGVGGSGLELASALGAQQAAADRAGQQSLGVSGQAQQRALQAMQLSGSLGGQLNAQEQARAAAQDSINRFNTGLRNEQQLYNVSTKPQQQFNNQMTLAGAKANAQNNIGANADTAGARFGKLVQAGIKALPIPKPGA